jgi:hypothetical protein
MKPVKKAQPARSNRPALLQLAYELFIAAAIIAASLGIVGWLILKGTQSCSVLCVSQPAGRVTPCTYPAGIVKPPIPYPAVDTVVNLYPPEIMPWQPRAPEVRLVVCCCSTSNTKDTATAWLLALPLHMQQLC